MNAKAIVATALAALLVTAGVTAAAGVGASAKVDSSATDANMEIDAQLTNGTVTMTVTHNGSGVEGVEVYVDDEKVGTTDANGSVTFQTNASEELEVTLQKEQITGELEYRIEDGSLVLVSQEIEFEQETEDAEEEQESEDEQESENESEQESEDADEERENETDDEEPESAKQERESESAEEERDNESANASERRGPPADMPEQAAGHVSEIHSLIGKYLAGDLNGSLGAAISDVVGNSDAEANGQAGANSSAQADGHAAA